MIAAEVDGRSQELVLDSGAPGLLPTRELSIAAYALVQFLLTIITLSEVGRLYIREFPSRRRQD